MNASLRGTGRQYGVAVKALLVFTVVLGVLYPLVITGIGQLALPAQANGSALSRNGKVVGSSLIGQGFVDAKGRPLPQWFQSRPSAAGAGWARAPPAALSAIRLAPQRRPAPRAARRRISKWCIVFSPCLALCCARRGAARPASAGQSDGFGRVAAASSVFQVLDRRDHQRPVLRVRPTRHSNFSMRSPSRPRGRNSSTRNIST